jgi:DNA-binding MurR/RpiR family transcriptional regulator
MLLADFPAAGLKTVAELSALAGVSTASVVRYANRLGYAGFTEFQEALRAHIYDRLASPAELADRPVAGAVTHPLHSAIANIQTSVATTLERLPMNVMDAVVEVLANPKNTLYFIGGRHSRSLANYLEVAVRHLRPKAHLLGEVSSTTIDKLVDMDRHSILVAFDYRRYQRDTVLFAEEAAKRKAQVVLFTDTFVSPIFRVAAHVITSVGDSALPFDGYSAVTSVLDILSARLVEKIGNPARDRMRHLDQIRKTFHLDEDMNH